MMTRTRKAKTITEDLPPSGQQQNKKQKQTAAVNSDDNMADTPVSALNSTSKPNQEPLPQPKEGLNASIHSSEMNLDAENSNSPQHPEMNTDADPPQKRSDHSESNTEQVGEPSNTNDNNSPLDLDNLNLSFPDDFFLGI